MMNLKTWLSCMVILSPCWDVSAAFQPYTRSCRSRTTTLLALPTYLEAKENLIEVANRLKTNEGVLLVDANAKSELQKAVSELEALASPPTLFDFEKRYQGDWTLVCSTATNTGGVDFSRIPFLNQDPLKNIRDAINRSLVVKQRIRSMSGDTLSVDRIDHVLEYQPPDTLREILDNIPEALTSFNINPLQVSQGTVTLVHKAEVQSVIPVLRTKLSLESVILSVAGTSQYLDPVGADVLGVNVPLGEFLNAGSFDTTYMDDDIRISRGKLGLVEQLRVFVRSTPLQPDATQVTDTYEPADLGENAGEVMVNGADDDTDEAETITGASVVESTDDVQSSAVDDTAGNETEEDIKSTDDDPLVPSA